MGKERRADHLYPSQCERREANQRDIGRIGVAQGTESPVLEGDVNEGFRIHFRANLDSLSWPILEGSKGAVFVTETELFGRRRNRKVLGRKKALVAQSQVDQLLDFAELVDGEFVVHLQHGIAVYRGISKVDIGGQLREVLTLEFEDEILLHVPLQESHLVSRYVGITKTRPRLGKLGSNRWSKTREAAERATLDLAAQLLQIQAKRDLSEGMAFSPDTEWQREFESAFPFNETPDQMKAILASKEDMEKSKPMDRLVCGDVGYGKTEVAIRAAFKAVMDGKQVAILVPTTILAQQHFLNFRDRMAGYPIVVELVSRFRRPKEIKQILQATKQGSVDILIGTHRLIQKDVFFKDLGLVVVDEEQRFGVKHKEPLQAMEGNDRHSDPFRDPDSEDAVHGPHGRQGIECYRDGPAGAEAYPDDRQELRRKAGGRCHPQGDRSWRTGFSTCTIVSKQSIP